LPESSQCAGVTVRDVALQKKLGRSERDAIRNRDEAQHRASAPRRSATAVVGVNARPIAGLANLSRPFDVDNLLGPARIAGAARVRAVGLHAAGAREARVPVGRRSGARSRFCYAQ
jgi:hypothetical protein